MTDSSSSKQTIVVCGYLIRRPVGGLVWHYGQYVEGLRRLGHRVVYLEDSGDVPSCFAAPERGRRVSGEPTFQTLGVDPAWGLAVADDFFAGRGLDDAWGYYDAHGDGWTGPLGDRVADILPEADVLLNVSGGLRLRPWHQSIPKRVLIDTDPVFTQVRHRDMPVWLEGALEHNVFLTFAEGIGDADCRVPEDGLPWRPTRQPIVLDAWDREGAPRRDAPWTTVMSWRSYPPVVVDGTQFGVKSDAFGDYVDLPRTVDAGLELALEAPESVADDLASRGWLIRDALAVSRSPWRYRDYLGGSRGEFSVAKSAYAASRSGWFSERSAAYLAAGRPVVCQDTGFGERLPVGEGLLSFRDPEGARYALAEVERDWRRHAQAARRIAHDQFDSDRILSRMLDQIDGADGDAVPLDRCVGAHRLRMHRTLVAEVERVVPPDQTLLLLDDMALGIEGRLGSRVVVPFPSRGGLYWGRPADGDEAVRELERMSGEGHRYLALAESAAWWLDHYPAFGDRLRRGALEVGRHPDVVVYHLGGPP